MTAGDDRKICGLCGQDCSDRPRTRDKGGRYFCSACYDAAAARRRNAQSDAPLLADTHDVDATVLAALLEESAAPDPAPKRKPEACPRCGKAYEGDSRICPRCGRAAEKPAPVEDTVPEFTVPPPQGPAWHIPTWVIVGVPLVFLVAIVLAAMPRKRRAHVAPPPIVSPDGSSSAAANIAKPDVGSPHSFESEKIGFRYPGNWSIDEDYPGFDRDAYVVVDAGPDAQVILRIFESRHTVEEDLDRSLAELRGFGAGYEDRGALDAYGQLEGAGRTVTTYLGDRPVRYRLFVTRIGVNTMLEIHEVCPEQHLPTAEPGLALIARSLAAR